MKSDNTNCNTLTPYNRNLHNSLTSLSEPLNSASTLSSENLSPRSRLEKKSFNEKSRENFRFSNTNFGNLKYFALYNNSSAKARKNKILAILSVKKPYRVRSDYWPTCSYFALFLGHSGSGCASFLKKRLHNCIFEDVCFPTKPKQAIINGCIRADSEFLQFADEECDISGAFSVIVLIIGNKCYVANTGNAKAVISLDKSKSLMISQSHTTENSDEFTRIIKAGGKVCKDFALDLKGRKKETGDFKVLPIKQNYTRSFGDMDGKLAKYGGVPGVITAEPYVKSFKIKEKHDFILLGSENLFENSGKADLIHHIQETPHDPPISFPENFLKILKSFPNPCAAPHSTVLIGLNFK